MGRKSVEIGIEESSEGGFLVTTYDNGDVTSERVEKKPRKKRIPDKPYGNWRFGEKKESSTSQPSITSNFVA